MESILSNTKQDNLASEEQQMLMAMVRDFVNNEVVPFVPNMEKGEFPRHLIKKMGELGLMGIPIPTKYGGAGMDFMSYILTIYEISKVSPALGVILSVHTSVGTNPILFFGTEEQKQKFVPKLATGQYLGAFCLTEPSAGSDASSLQTRATKDGNEYIINGSKIFITNGGEADVYIVFAKTNSKAGSKGVSAFIVEKGTPGLVIGKDEKKMGLKGSRTVQLTFDHMRVPATNLLGEEGDGYKIALANLDAGRIGIAAQSLGIAEGAFEQALAYAKNREQFGKPIIVNQGVGFKLADMATRIEAAKRLVYHAAGLKNQGKSCAKESSMAKMFASDTAMYVATEAIQIHGGYGYTKEYDVERYFRDAKVTQIYEGTNEIQKIVIARHL
ncbi:acyl-CoA dehydrogenase [Caldibacillus thermolactis]|jgi:acyl-CoA dehydrogenase|uniref:Acyl-CoA dehydrogenase n=1 Tax=Pallidibacillus thermolactis TaxID=251051 RepID=A0ABT2WG30_9BACI|nr:acyl-CoA dehydrogenase [Pallidibacillus thermolactis]MCU9593896.1 acyl-CoA dehydrogenase [Pallidibacillus thermolactis]MCU9600217.1 acyl-CoA dehydrogenase [Pallidibacillus thermolactis subsp. kokeshiiformis]MED1673425.1 acyl-CoA dehydrogenase [Pallidibacillus thermolactis subsp. kokeshiiformis]